MSQTITLDASAFSGVIILGGSITRVPIPANGRVTVDNMSAISLLAAGAKYVSSRSSMQAIVGTPRAASAGRIVASVALSNGTLTIANQPDVPRQVAVYVDPGTSDITAGNIALTYVANDGSTQVDNVSAATPASTTKTVSSSKGAVTVTSVIVTAMAGGASPKTQVNDTNSLSVMVPTAYTAFTIDRTFADGAAEGQVAVASTAASYTPSTTPNGTHTYSAAFAYVSP